MCTFKGRYSDTEYNNLFADFWDKRSLYFKHTFLYTKWEKWVKVGTWKLRGEESI
jgi:hypothetical protein